MLREHDGATVLGRGGVRYLRDDRIEGGDPLEGLAPHAAEGLRRLDAMPNCGDLVIISAPDDATGEVASFEHQIGSHGGLGGPQTQAFVLHPSEWNLDGEIVGATELHRGFRAWLRSS
jgi:hypothetical protein